MQTTADRILNRMIELKRSQADIRRATSAGKATISSWVNGNTVPSGTYASSLASFLQCDTDWLMTGRSASKPDSNRAELPPNVVLIGANSEHAPVKVKYMDINQSCNKGCASDKLASNHSEYLSVELLKNNGLPTNGKGIVVMHACTDSMGYTIPNESIIIVDTNDITYDGFINQKVYVFECEGMMVCKRAIKNLNGSIVLMSDNADKGMYPDQAISRETFNQFNLIGRVHWVSHKV